MDLKRAKRQLANFDAEIATFEAQVAAIARLRGARRVTAHDDLATLRRMTGLIRDAVGFALAEKNIPHEPTWTLLVPQHLDDIDAALDRVEAELARLQANERHLTNLHDWRAKGEQEQKGRAEAAEQREARLREGLRRTLASVERRIESDDSMEAEHCDCVWCDEDRALLAEARSLLADNQEASEPARCWRCDGEITHGGRVCDCTDPDDIATCCDLYPDCLHVVQSDEAMIDPETGEAFLLKPEAVWRRRAEAAEQREARLREALEQRRHVVTSQSSPGDPVGHDGFECDPDCDACAFAREVARLRKELRRIANRYCLHTKGDKQDESACLGKKPPELWCSICIARSLLADNQEASE